MNREIYIRADGGAKLGIGHLMRSISLAHMLKGHFKITFFCRFIPRELAQELKKNNFLLKKIKTEHEFLNKLDKSVIVVLDGYCFDANYQKYIKKNKQAVLVYVDDKCDKIYYADLIINHAPDIKPYHYSGQHYTKYALGLKYALLRPAFLKNANKKHIKKIKSVFICFGGYDSKNLTYKALSEVLKNNKLEKILVIVGPSYNKTNTLKLFLKQDKRIKYFKSASEFQMLNAMLDSELAIVPASGVLIEALALGLVAFSGYYVDNQKKIYDGFKRLNAIYDAGKFHNMKLISKIWKEKKFKTRYKLIDGKSPIRLLKIFKSL